MVTEFKMPQLGESVVEGTVGKWLKKVGDPVQEYEPLLEVATDKVDTEIPSPATGVVLELRAQEGETVRVGQVIAVIGEASEAAPPAPAATPEPAVVERRAPAVQGGALDARVAPPPAEGTEERAGRGYLTPVVARMAAEQGVDLSRVEGTGRGGRITKRDLLRYLDSGPTPAPQPEAVAPPAPKPLPTPTPPATAPVKAVPAAPVPTTGAGDREVPLSKMRLAIVRHMRMAKDTAAHVTTFMEVDLSRVMAHRKAHLDEFAAEGIKLTYTPFFLEALVAGLKAYPMLNAVLAEDRLILRGAIHLGMAVDLGEEGLIVPVVRHADEKNLRGLARAVNDLAERARKRALSPDDVQGATCTLTNHGITGSLAGTPIIPMPTVGILGVGAIQKRAVVIESEWGDTIAIRPMAYLSLSFDHRVIDGATADRFLSTVVRTLADYGGS